MSSTIALIAHGSKKDYLVDFAIEYNVCLSRYRLIATDVIGQRVQAATKLPVERVLSGAMGELLKLQQKRALGRS